MFFILVQKYYDISFNRYCAEFFSCFFYIRNYWTNGIPLDMMTITIAAITSWNSGRQ